MLHFGNVRRFPATNMASEGELAEVAPSAPHSEALDLVHAAAQVLRNMKQQSVMAEARTRAFAERASGELKAARDRIRELEMDCHKLNGLVTDSKDRLLSAVKELEDAGARISALESRLDASEQRACEAEEMLLLVEDTIRSEIFEAMHSKRMISAAA